MPVTEDANEADSDVGFVTTNVEKGAIIVQHEDGRQFRLSWGESPESKPGGLRALPPGSYAWKGYRLLDEDEEGDPWYLSVTGHQLGSFEVDAGEVRSLEVDHNLYLTHQAKPSRGKVGVHMGFAGAHRAGASLYRNGSRVPVLAIVEDEKGRKVASGTIQYG